jgi:predicted methyltransferase
MTSTRFFAMAAAAACLIAAGAQAQAPRIPPAVAAALADPSRPAEDKARDADRKAAEIVAFSGVKAGDRVVDVYPGGGFFTRIFAAEVGPEGKVFMMIPKELADRGPRQVDQANAVKAGYQNVEVAVVRMADLKTLAPLDVVFVSQFYHAAPAGSGLAATATTHRIDEAAARQAIAGAGFKLVGSSEMLRHPADDRTLLVFNPAVRGKTDQFVLKYQKPK